MVLASSRESQGPETSDGKNLPNFTTSEERGRELPENASNDDNLEYSRPNAFSAMDSNIMFQTKRQISRKRKPISKGKISAEKRSSRLSRSSA